MTVRFITVWDIYQPGDVETFETEIETGLIAAGLARDNTEDDNAGATDLQTQITTIDGDVTDLSAIVSTVAEEYVDDAAAETGGVPVGGLYNTEGAVKVRAS